MKRVLILGLLAPLLAACDEASPPVADRAAARADRRVDGAVSREGAVTLEMVGHDEIKKIVQNHHGQVVVMDVWATYCPPCVREFPRLVALSHEYGSQGVVCLSLSLDFDGRGSPEDVEGEVLSFLRQQKSTLVNLLSSTPSDEMLAKLHLLAPPAVYVYDAHGRLAKRFDHSTDQNFSYEDVKRQVDLLLQK